MWAKKPPLRHTLGIFADVFSPNQPPWINKLPFSFLEVRFRALNLCVQLIPTLLSFTKKLRGSLICNLDLVIFFLVFRRIRMWFLVRKEHAVGDLRFVLYIYICVVWGSCKFYFTTSDHATNALSRYSCPWTHTTT